MKNNILTAAPGVRGGLLSVMSPYVNMVSHGGVALKIGIEALENEIQDEFIMSEPSHLLSLMISAMRNSSNADTLGEIMASTILAYATINGLAEDVKNDLISFGEAMLSVIDQHLAASNFFEFSIAS